MDMPSCARVIDLAGELGLADLEAARAAMEAHGEAEAGVEDLSRVLGLETRLVAALVEVARAREEGEEKTLIETSPTAQAERPDDFLEAVRKARGEGLAETLPERPPQVAPANENGKAAWRVETRVRGEAERLAAEVHRAERVPANRFGRYVLLSHLGAGGMGVVHRAWDTVLSRLVALKRLREDPQNPCAPLRERFLREGRSAARLRHPGIVAVHDVGEIEGRPYLTMELVEGTTLDERLIATVQLRERGRPEAWARQREEIAILARVAEAVGFAHAAGIVHRDLKPGNVLLDREGKPFVSDFGLAKDLLSSSGARGAMESLTLDGAVIGTPLYMSPEQALGKGVGPASDVFSLGVILYRLLAGRLPFEGDALPAIVSAITEADPVPPRRLSARLSRDLESICLRSLEKNPARRYQDASALAADLRRYLEGEPVEARPVSLARRLGRWSRRHPIAVFGLASALALAATAAGVRFEQQARARQDLRALAEIAELGAQARGAWRAGNSERLAECCAAVEERSGDLLARNPGAGELHLERGRLRLLAGSVAGREAFEGARADLDRAVEILGPDDPRPYAARGRLLLALHRRGLEEARLAIADPDQAVEATEEDLERLDPELARLREAAEQDLSTASAFAEDGPEQALLAAYLALARKDWAAVIEASDRALRFDSFAEAHWLRGQALLARGEVEAAEEAMHDAVRFGRAFADAWLGWAEARKTAIEAIRHDLVTEYVDGERSFEELERLRGEIEGAIEAAYRAMSLGADSNRIGRVLGELSWILGEVLRKSSYRPPVRDVRASLAPHLAALEGVHSRFQDARFLFHLAQIQQCYALGKVGDQQVDCRADLEKAVAWYSEAIRRKPEFVRAYYWRACALYELAGARQTRGGDPTEPWRGAIADYTHYLEHRPPEVDPRYAYLYRALCHYGLAEWGQLRGAVGIEAFRTALAELEALPEDEREAWMARALCRVMIASDRIRRGGEWSPGELAHVRAELDRALAEIERSEAKSATGGDRRMASVLAGRILFAQARLAEGLGESPLAKARLAAERFRRGEPIDDAWGRLWSACARSLVARGQRKAGEDGAPESRAALGEIARCPRAIRREDISELEEWLPSLLEVAAWISEAPPDRSLAEDALAFGRLAATMASLRPESGARDLAFAALRAAARHAPRDWAALADQDPDLGALRADPRWREISGR